MAGFRFIAIGDLTRVNVGQLLEAGARIDASFGVVLERGQPRSLVQFEHLSPAASSAPLSTVERDALTPVPGGVDTAWAAESVGFSREVAVFVHDEVPFVVPALEPLVGVADLTRLVGSGNVAAWAAMARLPGEREDIDPTEHECLCPRGHPVTIPANQSSRTCPMHGLQLMC